MTSVTSSPLMQRLFGGIVFLSNTPERNGELSVNSQLTSIICRGLANHVHINKDDWAELHAAKCPPDVSTVYNTRRTKYVTSAILFFFFWHLFSIVMLLLWIPFLLLLLSFIYLWELVMETVFVVCWHFFLSYNVSHEALKFSAWIRSMTLSYLLCWIFPAPDKVPSCGFQIQ